MCPAFFHGKEYMSVRLVVERDSITGVVQQELLEACLLQQSDYQPHQPHNTNRAERSVTQQESTVLEKSDSLYCVKQRLIRAD